MLKHHGGKEKVKFLSRNNFHVKGYKKLGGRIFTVLI